MKIEPCPFCESKDVELLFTRFGITKTNTEVTEYYVACNMCLSSGPHNLSEKDATKLWNETSKKVIGKK